MSDVTIELHSRRGGRVQAVQKLQHIVPGVALLLDGLQTLGTGAGGVERAIAIGEIVTCSLFLASVVRKLRQLRQTAPTHHHAHGVDWVDIFISAMLAVEVWEHWYTTGHIRRPTVLLSITLLVIGLLHGRMMNAALRRSALRITDDGLRVGFRNRLLPSFSARWSDIMRIDLSDTTARIVLKSGRMRRINLKDLRNATEVREGLRIAAKHLRA